MCKFCVDYGLGEKWYLNVKNHLKQMERDPEQKKVFVDGAEAEKFPGTEALRDRVDLYINPARHEELREQRERETFGQVVPWEDAVKIIEMASIVGVQACICRRQFAGINLEVCIKFGLLPKEVYDQQPFPERKIHPISKEEAISLIKDCDRRGFFHTVFTWLTPYVGSVCNCEYPACGEFRERMLMGVEGLIFKSHYVSIIDFDKCNGCKKCLTRCPVGSIRFSPSLKKAMVDPTRCFGCGLCRYVCNQDAIKLAERESIAGLKEVW